MKKFLCMFFIFAALISMGINIEWSKNAVKAFITGGIIVWMIVKLWKK